MVTEEIQALYFDGRFYTNVSREFWAIACLILEEDGTKALRAALGAEGYTYSQVMELTAIAIGQVRARSTLGLRER